jgi:Uma2 family endonuclease
MPAIAAAPRIAKPVAAEARCVVRIAPDIVIPDWVNDHESFREWAQSDDFPQWGRFAFYRDSIWMNPETEEAYFHNLLKLEFGSVLHPIARKIDRGHFFTDGMLLTNMEAGFTTIPDGMFISYEALESGLIRESAGTRGRCTEFVGTPDMTLEILSRYSEQKDRDFQSLFFQAGVAEYWIVDGRTEPASFEVLKRGPRKYQLTRPQAGRWLKSNVFSQSFRLSQSADRRGRPMYRLEVKG